jgi:hypothetical protein
MYQVIRCSSSSSLHGLGESPVPASSMVVSLSIVFLVYLCLVFRMIYSYMPVVECGYVPFFANVLSIYFLLIMKLFLLVVFIAIEHICCHKFWIQILDYTNDLKSTQYPYKSIKIYRLNSREALYNEVRWVDLHKFANIIIVMWNVCFVEILIFLNTHTPPLLRLCLHDLEPSR